MILLPSTIQKMKRI